MRSGNVDTTQKAKINAAMGTKINVEHESAKFNLHLDNRKSSIKRTLVLSETCWYGLRKMTHSVLHATRISLSPSTPD